MLTHHFSLWTILLPVCDVIHLVCSFQVTYYYMLLRDTLPFPLHMIKPPCISVDLLQGGTLAFDKAIMLTYMHYHSQEITLLPTVGTPTPNCLRSSWDFLLGRSHDMMVGPTPSKFLVIEGGPNDKLSPQILLLNLSTSFMTYITIIPQ